MLVPGPAQLGLIAIIIALVFGTKRLRDVGGDIGGMFKGIKDGFREARTAADEIGPEIRALKDDARALKQHGTELVDTRIPYVRMSDGSNDRSDDPRYVAVDHQEYERRVRDPLSRGAEVGHNMGPYGDDY